MIDDLPFLLGYSVLGILDLVRNGSTNILVDGSSL